MEAERHHVQHRRAAGCGVGVAGGGATHAHRGVALRGWGVPQSLFGGQACTRSGTGEVCVHTCCLFSMSMNSRLKHAVRAMVTSQTYRDTAMACLLIQYIYTGQSPLMQGLIRATDRALDVGTSQHSTYSVPGTS